MKISDVMVSNVASIDQRTPISNLIKAFLERRVDVLPVVDNNCSLVGCVSLEELVSVLFPRYYEIVKDYTYLEDFGLLEQVFLAQSELVNEDKLILTCDLMNQKIASISEEESILQGVSLMKSNGLNRLPVVNRSGRLVGIISHIDIVLALFGRSFRQVAL